MHGPTYVNPSLLTHVPWLRDRVDAEKDCEVISNRVLFLKMKFSQKNSVKTSQRYCKIQSAAVLLEEEASVYTLGSG